ASALDVEPSDATPDQAASWAYHRLSLHPHAIAHIYTGISEWPQVQAACARLPAWMQSHIRWWIADPTGVAHIVPGSDATQWYWGSSYDIPTATPRFYRSGPVTARAGQGCWPAGHGVPMWRRSAPGRVPAGGCALRLA